MRLVVIAVVLGRVDERDGRTFGSAAGRVSTSTYVGGDAPRRLPR